MDTNPSLEQYVPEKLLGIFKNASFTLALIISLAIHLMAVGGTSVGYITDRWINPEGAKQRKLEAHARLQSAEASNLVSKATAATNAPLAAVKARRRHLRPRRHDQRQRAQPHQYGNHEAAQRDGQAGGNPVGAQRPGNLDQGHQSPIIFFAANQLESWPAQVAERAR
jgi:hypothetical protein